MRSYGRDLKAHRRNDNYARDHERIRREHQRELTISNLEHLCRYFPYDSVAGRKSWKLSVESQLYQLAVQNIEIPMSVSARVNNLLELCNDRTPAKRANNSAYSD